MRARRPTRTALLVAVVLASLAAASPALGNRSVAKHMAGGVSVAFAANNNVWITDTGQEGLDNNPGQNGLYEYDAYPSQTLLEVPNTFSVWSYYILDLQAAVDQENGEVFVAQSNGRTIDIFAEDEKHKFAYSHSWTAINGDGVCFSCTPSSTSRSITRTPTRGGESICPSPRPRMTSRPSMPPSARSISQRPQTTYRTTS